ncbi:MAG: TetR family transcriptional regulator [Acidipropionibacterium sp.]|nr:TetR family transcriptional regulator [Acidipropionibacterium sp.]
MTEAAGPRRRGRRPGARDTRQEIVDAARELFSTLPFDGVSLRAIARRADVDPALVHHYFSGKAELFLTATADVSADPVAVFGMLDAIPAHRQGAALVLAFTAVWDAAGRTGRFTEFATTMLATPELTAGAREFITEQIGERVSRLADPDERTLRATLVLSQMLGMAMMRYALNMEPVASMTRSRLADLYGPTLQHYLSGRLSPGERWNSSPSSQG